MHCLEKTKDAGSKIKPNETIFLLIVAILAFVAISMPLQQAYSAPPVLQTFVADDPDDADNVYSDGDTFTITFDIPTNQTGTATGPNIRGNFTFTEDPGFIIVGEWTDSSTLVITSDGEIVKGSPPVIGVTTVAMKGDNNIGDLTNDGPATGGPVTLAGDFGLFVAVSATSGGGGCRGDCQEPTLGVTNDGRRLVENGLTYNENTIDVERFFTPYPLITVDVGVENKAVFKIYDNLGPSNIRHFAMAFGLAPGQIMGTSDAVIEWNKSFDGTETVTLVDPHNVLDNVRVLTSEGKCRAESADDCLIVTVFHTFREPLESDMVGTNVWDYRRNSWQNFFNHGVHIEGESLNPPDEYVGIHKGKLVHLFETGKNTAIDEEGNTWTFDKTWTMDFIPKGKIDDGVTSHGFDRNHARFDAYKQEQVQRALSFLEQLCPECIIEPFEEINDIFSYEYPERSEKLLDPEVQQNILEEIKIAQQKLEQLYPNLKGI